MGVKGQASLRQVAGRQAEREQDCRPAEYCKKCGRVLIPDEAAMTKKLINRGTTVYYCTDCLAEIFDVKRSDIEEKIVYYKKSGCTLFQ